MSDRCTDCERFYVCDREKCEPREKEEGDKPSDEKGVDMELPKTIKIGCHEYIIEFPTNDINNDLLGLHCGANNLIQLSSVTNNRELPDTTIITSLIHEALHAIDEKSKLHLFKDEDGSCDDDKLQGLAEWLCMILFENQQLLDLFRR